VWVDADGFLVCIDAKKQRRDISATALFRKRKAFCALAYFLMTFACPSAIASRAALDVFAPVIAALSSVLLLCSIKKNNAATFLPRRCFVKEKLSVR
jgi:hypothetical protein